MFRKPLFWAILCILLIGGGAAAGYYYYTGGFTRAETQTAQENQVTTAPVTTGDLIIRVDGVGNLLASQELELGFGTSGVVKSVGVQPGAQVKVGTVLATLDDTTARYDVVEAGVTLRQAQLQLAKLTQPTAASIADAKATLASAQADLTKLTQPAASQVAAAQADLLSAQQAYSILVGAVNPNKQVSLQADLKSAEVALSQAQSAYNKISWRGDVGATTESANLQNATIAYEKSKADYDLTAEGPAADAISAARAKISTAQDTLSQLTHPDVNTVEASKAKVAAAQASLDSLTKGGDPQDAELAQLAVQQAEDSLRAKMLDLANTVITSPITGTVTAADVTIGLGKSTLMNILGCLDRLTSGLYILDGEDVSRLDKVKLAGVRNRKIGFVFQSFNLLPRLSALKNVLLPMKYSGYQYLPEAERRARATKILESVGLGNRMNHSPNKLSGGQ